MAGQPAHYEIGVPDVERARAFYGSLLDWDFDSTEHGAQIETDPVAGGIHPDNNPGIQLFFSVPDIDEAKRRIIELGGEVDAGSSEGPHGRYLHSCRDNQGVPFGLHQPAR